MATTVWALDFDGVLVDSARETGIAGWKTLGALLRKEPFVSAAPQASIDAFVLARPVLETGWEAALMLWLIAAEGVSGEALLCAGHPPLRLRGGARGWEGRVRPITSTIIIVVVVVVVILSKVVRV